MPVRWEAWGVWGVVFGQRRAVGGNPDRLTGTAWPCVAIARRATARADRMPGGVGLVAG